MTDAPFQINVFVPLGLEMPPEDQVKKWKENIPLANQVNQFTSVQEEWDDFYQKIDLILKYKVKACSFTFDLPPEDAVKEPKNRWMLFNRNRFNSRRSIVNGRTGNGYSSPSRK